MLAPATSSAETRLCTASYWGGIAIKTPAPKVCDLNPLVWYSPSLWSWQLDIPPGLSFLHQKKNNSTHSIPSVDLVTIKPDAFTCMAHAVTAVISFGIRWAALKSVPSPFRPGLDISPAVKLPHLKSGSNGNVGGKGGVAGIGWRAWLCSDTHTWVQILLPPLPLLCDSRCVCSPLWLHFKWH